MRDPPPQLKENEDETDEEVATHLGGGKPMTSHFTMANANSKEDN